MTIEAEYGETLDWLLEAEDPGVRYLALRDLVDQADPTELSVAREAAHQSGPIATILDNMQAPGFWAEPGPGYLPKYRSTVWSIILLAQLGARVDMDARIAQACEYVLDHTLTEYGQFSSSGTPGATADCLQGNLLTSLPDLGYEDPRLEAAFEWMARTVTGEGLAPFGDKSTPLRYYAGKRGPGFICGANNNQSCAWGAVKVMVAFSKLPAKRRSPLIQEAIQAGVDFLFGVDPATALYPSGYNDKPSGNWWKFGFPVFYVTDLLQNVEALVRLGYGDDPRLAAALELISDKRDDAGRWPLEYSYQDKTWVDFGEKKKPNKWVTLRALRTLKQADKVS